MLGRGRSAKLRKNAIDASELARQLAQDRKFRKRLSSAIGHGVKARRRARREVGLANTIRRMATDERLLRELRSARDDLQKANRRVRRRRRSHKLRNAALVGSVAGLAAVPQVRQKVTGVFSDESVRNCAYVGSVGDPGFSTNPPPGEISIEGRSTSANGIFVAVFNSGGTLTDTAYHVAVFC